MTGLNESIEIGDGIAYGPDAETHPLGAIAAVHPHFLKSARG
jgi:hypothetical protein